MNPNKDFNLSLQGFAPSFLAFIFANIHLLAKVTAGLSGPDSI